MKYVYLGKIVNTHGIKGELRLISNFKYKSRVFKKGFKIYIGKDKITEEINSYRPHKQFDMIALKGYSNINEVLKYKMQYAYIDRDDLKLAENEYLDEDLINLSVWVEDKYKGIVKRIDKNKFQDIIVVINDKKQYLIPYVDEFVEKIDLKDKKIFIKNIKGLIE